MSTSGSSTRSRIVVGGMLKECGEPGCHTLTLGERCIAHEAAVVVELPRGVPYLEPASLLEDAWVPVADPRFVRA